MPKDLDWQDMRGCESAAPQGSRLARVTCKHVRPVWGIDSVVAVRAADTPIRNMTG